MKHVPVKYKRHIFVCINKREEGDCCSARNSEQILLKLREHVNRNGLFHSFNISKAKCLGHCSEGPTIAIYPDGKIFKDVRMEDVDRIIGEFLTI